MKNIILIFMLVLSVVTASAQVPEYKAVSADSNGNVFWPANLWGQNKSNLLSQTGALTNEPTFLDWLINVYSNFVNEAHTWTNVQSFFSITLGGETRTNWPSGGGGGTGDVSTWAQYIALSNIDVGTNSIILGGVPRTNWPTGGSGKSSLAISVSWSEGTSNNVYVVDGTNLYVLLKTNYNGGSVSGGGVNIYWNESTSNNVYVVDGTNIYFTFKTNYSASVGILSHTNLIEQDGSPSYQHITESQKLYITNQTVLTGESGVYFRVDGGTTYVGYAAP